MRVWRRVELDRVEPGLWRLCWHRASTATATTEEVCVFGSLRGVLRWAPRLMVRMNGLWR